MSGSGRCLVAFALCSYLTYAAGAGGTRRENTSHLRDLQVDITCQLTYIDAQFEDRSLDIEEYACIIDEDKNGYGDMAYAINLPDDFIELHKAEIGSGLFINIPGGQVNYEDEPFIEFPGNATISVVDGFGSQNDGRQLNSITGDRWILVVRVSINNKSPDPSSLELAGAIFGVGPGWNIPAQSMAGQYSDCSFGQLEFFPVTGNSNVKFGVVDVAIYSNDDNVLNMRQNMLNAANTATSNSLNKSPDHIMFVVAKGTKYKGSDVWVAFAYVGGKSSFFNNDWGKRLSSEMHEIAHNFGFQHSSEDTVEYGDQTDMLGYSYRTVGGPLMCFNAFKNYKFGWYITKTAEVNPWMGTWTGELASFVDFANAAVSTVLVKTGDIYAQFNRMDGMNSGVKEKGDTVTLTWGSAANQRSYNKGGLSTGDVFSENGKSIEVCKIAIGKDDYDYAIVSLYVSSQQSGCPNYDYDRSTGVYLSQSRNAGCEDDPTVSNLPDKDKNMKKDCGWINEQVSKSKLRNQTWSTFCNATTEDGKFVSQYCPVTCGTCPQ